MEWGTTGPSRGACGWVQVGHQAAGQACGHDQEERAVKLRHPWIVKCLGAAAAGVVRLGMSTVRRQTDSQGQRTDPWDVTMNERFIYAFWHECMLFAAV